MNQISSFTNRYITKSKRKQHVSHSLIVLLLVLIATSKEILRIPKDILQKWFSPAEFLCIFATDDKSRDHKCITTYMMFRIRKRKVNHANIDVNNPLLSRENRAVIIVIVRLKSRRMQCMSGSASASFTKSDVYVYLVI